MMTGMCPYSRHHIHKGEIEMEQWFKVFEIWNEYVERLERNPDDGVALLLEKHYAKELDKIRMGMMK